MNLWSAFRNDEIKFVGRGEAPRREVVIALL
jgi:hypothetical protein